MSLEGSTPSPSACPRGAARSARHPVTVEIMGSNPIGDAWAKWWNRQTRDAQTVVPSGMGVRLSPWSLRYSLSPLGRAWGNGSSLEFRLQAARLVVPGGSRNSSAGSGSLKTPMVKRTIMPRFERGVPGSNPGRGIASVCWDDCSLTGGPGSRPGRSAVSVV